MCHSRWNRPGLKRFNLMQDPRMEYIFAGLLGLIIVVSLVVTLQRMFFPTLLQGEPENTQPHVCMECGEAVWINAMDLMPDANDPDAVAAQGYGMLADCPKCNAQAAAVPAEECPNCHKYYAIPGHVLLYKYTSKGLAIPRGASYVRTCPHCNTNVDQWYKAKLEERKRERRGE